MDNALAFAVNAIGLDFQRFVDLLPRLAMHECN